MVREALLDHVAIPSHNVHRMRSELPAAQAAADYEAELHTVFGDELPRFDLVLMGLGEDGHTASLFPHTTVLHERTRWVAENTVPQLDIERITLTIPVFNNAAAMLFLVAGASKAEAVAAILEGAPDPETYPTQFIQPTNGTLTWLLDVPAAAQLQRLPEQPGTSS